MRYTNLSIRRKILLSNFLMILIPITFVGFILLTILLGFSLIQTSSSSLIRSVLLNSSNYGPTLLIKTMNDELASSETITPTAKTIFRQLEASKMRIMIEHDGKITYMSEGASEALIQQEFTQVAQTTSYQEPYILWNQTGIAYRSSLTNQAQQSVHITFVGKGLALPADSYASWENAKDKIKLTIILVGGFMILFIIILGIILTKKLSKHILKPLKELQHATKEIEQGNLRYCLDLSSDDEIGQVCRNFDTMRRQLLSSAQMQKHFDQNQKELIAGISHDLSTPLTSIQGYVSGLKDGIADTPEKQQRYLQIIYDKTVSMNTLVESLFLLSKLDLGQELFHDEVVNMHSYISDWVEDNKLRFHEAGLEISYHNTLLHTIPIVMDRSHFARVLENICQNSLKYKKANTAQLTISFQLDGPNVTLSLQDDGIGIQSDEAEKLFESFYRSDPSRSSRVKGNGLGLSITKRIIEHMHGTINAKGEIDKGLLIRISLTMKQEDEHS